VAGSGTGSVYQRKGDGRWVAVVTLSGGKRVSRYAASEREARQRLKELIGREHAGTLSPPSRLTVAAWAEQWLALAETRCRPKTIDNYRYGLRPLLKLLGGIRLDRLTPLQLATAFSEMERQGKGHGAVNLSFDTVRACLRYATRLGIISTNPLDRIDRPRRQTPERQYWTAEETRRFIAQCERDGGQYGPLFVFLLATGLRRGEAMGLRWADLDFKAKKVKVRRAIVHISNRPLLQETKTRAGMRTITLPEVALRSLARLPRPLDPQAAVFVNRLGRTPAPPNTLDALRRLCRRAGVPAVPLHGLRHIHAALLAAEGVDPHTLRRRLGHARVSTSMEVYAYAINPDDTAVVAFERATGGG
jgi:integrase